MAKKPTHRWGLWDAFFEEWIEHHDRPTTYTTRREAKAARRRERGGDMLRVVKLVPQEPN